MLKRNKDGLVENPERDPEFSKLKAEQERCHADLERLGAEIARARAGLDQHASQTLAGMKQPDPAETRKLAETVDAAMAARDRVRARYREIVQQLPLARSKAARKIADQHRDAFNGGVGKYLKARLERLAPEIIATTGTLRLSAELEARRVARTGMVPSSSMIAAQTEFDRLREDTRAALAAGILKPADLPADLRKAWGIT